MKKISTGLTAFQYFYPYTVALVGAGAGKGVNYLSCAWHSALSFDPPLFGVLISKKRYTHSLIAEAREFTVNFLGYEKVKLSAWMGRRSGRDLDKVGQLQVRLAPSKVIATPVVEEAYVSFECRLVETQTYGDHDLFVGEVLAVHEEEKSFTPEGVLDTGRVRPLLYLGSDLYVTVDPGSLTHVLPED